MAVAAIGDFFSGITGGPDVSKNPAVVAAQTEADQAQEAAKTAAKALEDAKTAAKEAAKNPQATGTSEDAAAALKPKGGRRRGRHTKRHRKSRKGKSKRARTGRKSSRL
jgi:hypothetical protein